MVVKKDTTHNKSSRRRRRRNRRSARSGMHPSVYARVNPYCPLAAGARCPDEFGYPTATAVLKNQLNLVTNSGGFYAGAWSYHPNRFFQQYASIDANGTVTWAGGSTQNVPQLDALRQMAQVVRSVGWGLRITTDLSLTSASGHLWIAHCPEDTSRLIQDTLPSTEAQFATLPVSMKFSLVELAERPLIVPGKAFDNGIYRFRDVDDDWKDGNGYQVESSTGWTNIAIYITGAPASANCINVEYINHIEYVQGSSTLYGFVDVAPEVPDPIAQSISAQYESAAPVGLLETSIDTVAKVEQVINSTIGIAQKTAGLIAGVSRVASYAAAARGWFNNPSRQPFQLTYS